jgi:hypothetical protein
LYKIRLISENIKAMKNLIDSINITLEVLQNYNDFLSTNKRNDESEKIFKQQYFNSKDYSVKNKRKIR